MFEKGGHLRHMVRPDLLALRLFPRTIGLEGLSLIVRKNSCQASPRYLPSMAFAEDCGLELDIISSPF